MDDFSTSEFMTKAHEFQFDEKLIIVDRTLKCSKIITCNPSFMEYICQTTLNQITYTRLAKICLSHWFEIRLGWRI